MRVIAPYPPEHYRQLRTAKFVVLGCFFVCAILEAILLVIAGITVISMLTLALVLILFVTVSAPFRQNVWFFAFQATAFAIIISTLVTGYRMYRAGDARSFAKGVSDAK